MSARPVPAQVPGTRASLTRLLRLSEKEARIAKERELGIYKEHKVGAPPPRGLSAHLRAVLAASRPQTAGPGPGWSRLRRRTAGGCSVGHGQRVALATQGPVSPGRVRGPSQP